MSKCFAEMQTSGYNSPQTRRGHQRRLALLECASALFLEHGFDAVSLDDIVNLAGGSKTTIYKYFGNKEGLFIAICDFRIAIFFKDICTAFEPNKDDLRAYLIRNLNNFHQHLISAENAAFYRLIIERTKTAPELAQYIYSQGPKMIQTAIAKALESAHNQKIIHCPQPFFSAQLYLGIIHALEWKTLMGIDVSKDDPEINAYFDYCVDRFLDGHQTL